MKTRRIHGFRYLTTKLSRRGAAGLIATLALGLLTFDARAFCGFYVGGADAKLFNNATQVVLMREGQRTVLSMQNAYQGPPENFAMVVPVPVILQKENVKTLPRDVFDKVDQLTAPRLVEYWERDPCEVDRASIQGGFGFGGLDSETNEARGSSQGNGVRVEARFSVGEYEVVILSAEDATGLEQWLKDNQYKIPNNAEAYLRPYVQQGSKFFVAKVDVTKVTMENGLAVLSPLRFHYDSDAFTLPVRLGLINSGGTQDLIVNILASQQRYEVANYTNVTIPTNLEVAEATKDQFGQFYAALYDQTVTANPRSVVTEYAWDASSCDPCPTPPLDEAALATLGADVLPSNQVAGATTGPGSSRSFGSGFVITRLHARYGNDALGNDMVFRAAPPIVGGREFLANGQTLEKGAASGSINNFQGRYAIRHAWAGLILCTNPIRNRWGGPPGGDSTTQAASKIQFVARGGVDLTSLVREDVPEIGLKAGALGTTSSTGGCSGCTTAGRHGIAWAGTGLLGAVLALAARRRRRLNRR